MVVWSGGDGDELSQRGHERAGLVLLDMVGSTVQYNTKTSWC